MINALALLLSAIALAPAAGGQVETPPKTQDSSRYVYGDPPREGTAIDVKLHLSQWALATLDKKEQEALQKLKAVGFVVKDYKRIDFVVRGGKRIVTPPAGIVLGSPKLGGLGSKTLSPTANDVALLRDLRHVERLTLAGKFVTDATLDLLRNMEPLAELTVLASHITDGGLKKLAPLKNLRRFTCDSPDVTDAGLGTLATFAGLEGIQLMQSRVTDAGIGSLAGHVNLREISIIPGSFRNTLEITDQSLAVFGTIPQLTTISLGKCRITPAGFAATVRPGNLSNLISIKLSETPLSDAELKLLHNPKVLPSLKILALDRTKISREGAVALQHARPGLVISVMFTDGKSFHTGNSPRH